MSLNKEFKPFKISIALCTYNGAQFLQEQLESIALQTRIPDEMIICDDQSKDGTLEILRNFASKVSFPVRVRLNETNLGSTKNFEKAIKLCTGDIIFLSDQDDLWHPDKLEQIEKVFFSNPHVDAVFTNAEVVDECSQPLGYTLWESVGFYQREQKLIKAGKPLKVLVRHNVVTGATMAFRSKLRFFLLPIPAIWVHDAWIALLVAFMSNLEIISEPLIKYRQHSMQQIGAGYEQNLFSIIKGTAHQFNQVQNDPRRYSDWYNQYKLAYENLTDRQLPLADEDSIQLIENKISHLKVRANLPKGKIQRLPILIKELIKLNYHRYSYGFYSFGGDILR